MMKEVLEVKFLIAIMSQTCKCLMSVILKFGI